MLQKQISKLLSVCLLSISILPVTQTNKVYSSSITLHNPKFNDDGMAYDYDYIWFGNYWQNDTNGDGVANEQDIKEPILWKVLSVNGNDAFLLSQKILNIKPYNDEDVYCTWETCTLRTWLNNEFYDAAFSNDEKKAIKNTHVKNDNNPLYETNGGNDTYDHIYLLSFSEAANTNYGLARYCYLNYKNTGETVYLYNNIPDDTPDNGIYLYNNTAEATPFTDNIRHYANEYICFRSPGKDNQHVSCTVWNNVDHQGNFVTKNYGIQPVLHINLSSTAWKYDGTEISGNTGSGSGSSGSSSSQSGTSSNTSSSISKNDSSYILNKVVAGTYHDGAIKKDILEKAIYSDDYFTKDSTKAQGGLAKLSILASSIVYNKNKNATIFDRIGTDGKPKERKCRKAEKLLYDCGFKGIKYIEKKSNSKKDNDHVSYALGYKNIDNYTLIAVIVKGTSGDYEWISNFEIGKKGKTHLGFSKAEKELRKYILDEYMYLLKDKMLNTKKFWVTGHSRGAAVANLLAANLKKYYKTKNIYAYTFATPNVSKNGKKAGYENIFNYLGRGDFVTEVAPKKWGYKRYGKDITMTSKEETAMKIRFKTISAKKYGGYGKKGKESMVNAFLKFGGKNNKEYYSVVGTFINNKGQKVNIKPVTFFRDGLGGFLATNNLNNLGKPIQYALHNKKARNCLIKLGADGSGIDLKLNSNFCYKFGHAHCQTSYIAWIEKKYDQ